MEEIKTGVFVIKEEIPIYIIGDIHGDYQCLIHCLVDLCGVATIKSVGFDKKFNEPNREYLEWNENNNSVVVFCGDLIHRKRFQDNVLDDECSDIYIIKTLLRLKRFAKMYMGDIIIVSGNHEIMNLVDPSDNTYTSDKNVGPNKKYFTNPEFINNYILNTFAWVKINDILVAHGGLCSDYLKFLDGKNIFSKKIFSGGSSRGGKENRIQTHIMFGGESVKIGNDVIEFVNNKYRDFFTNYSGTKSKTDSIGFKLFMEYDFKNKNAHNVFWCREWGYSGINCDNLDDLVKKIDCTKMIIAHCPQFLAENEPKMINFECLDYDSMCVDCAETSKKLNPQKFKIARVDLGMSRSFENNTPNDFEKYLSYNYNRKMAVLKLTWDNEHENYYFNYDSIITEKLSCIQYLLVKYGMRKKDWDNINVQSNWIGFNLIENMLDDIKNKTEQEQQELVEKCNNTNIDVVLCLLYPLIYSKPNLKSSVQFNSFVKK